MRLGTVTGRLWATKRHPSLPTGAFVTIQMEDSQSLVALDGLGVGVGEEVLVVQGSVATAFGTAAVDAVVVGIVDPQGK